MPGASCTTRNPLNETTAYTYNAQRCPTKIDPPLAGTADQIQSTYDAKGRVSTRTQLGY